MAFGGGGMAWGDIDDDDTQILPPPRIMGPDKNGIKTTITYKIEDGVRYKVTEKRRVVTLEHKISKAAIERMNTWERFGDAAGDVEKNKSLTYTSYEDIWMEDPESKKEDEQAKTLSSLLNWAKGRKHKFSGGAGGEGAAAAGGEEEKNPNRYLAPHMRGAGGSAAASRMMAAASDGRFRDEGHTLRVTNISEDTREVDLQELFRPFGRTTRIYLAKDRVTMQSRGFAFVTFMHKEDAQRAMDKLDGYGYDHLILKLEWAQPSVRDPQSSGLGGGFTSGYGKALPQGLG